MGGLRQTIVDSQWENPCSLRSCIGDMHTLRMASRDFSPWRSWAVEKTQAQLL